MVIIWCVFSKIGQAIQDLSQIDQEILLFKTIFYGFYKIMVQFLV